MTGTPDLTLVLACYNEEAILETSVSRILAVLDGMPLSHEVIFVDDGSQDRTREIIDRILAAAPDRSLRRIFHDRNRGRGRAVSTGMLAAAGAIVGFIDVDLEVEARYIPLVVGAIQDGAAVATARRVFPFTWRSAQRYAMSKGYAWLVRRLLQLPTLDTESGFKFFRRDVILPVLATVEADGWFWDTEIMAQAFRAGLRIVELPCPYVRRFDKASSVSPWRDSVEYGRQLWRFSRQPRNRRTGR